MLHVAWTTLDVVMLSVARITLDDAAWMVLQFFYTSVMLHVARITLDDAE